MRQKREQDGMRTLCELGFTEEEARNGTHYCLLACYTFGVDSDLVTL